MHVYVTVFRLEESFFFFFPSSFSSRKFVQMSMSCICAPVHTHTHHKLPPPPPPRTVILPVQSYYFFTQIPVQLPKRDPPNSPVQIGHTCMQALPPPGPRKQRRKRKEKKKRPPHLSFFFSFFFFLSPPSYHFPPPSLVKCLEWTWMIILAFAAQAGCCVILPRPRCSDILERKKKKACEC